MIAEPQRSPPDTALALDGDLTVYTAVETLATLRTYLKDRDVCALDLSAVTEIDSAGLQLLLWTRHAALQQGMQFRLVRRSAAVAETIALLQLEPLFGGAAADRVAEDPS